MNLLSLAVNAKLPLVSVETDDTMNVMKVLTAELGIKVRRPPELEKTIPPMSGKKVKVVDFGLCLKDTIYCLRDGDLSKFDWPLLYNKFTEIGSTLIVVNPDGRQPEIFDAGFVSCPQALITEFATKFAEPEDSEFSEIVSALSGLSYQNMARMCLLAQAHAGHVTGAALREVRRSFFGTVRGLIQENAEVPFYAPNERLESWLELEGKLFSDNTPAVLRARGLLLDGPPGTGKTMGAKYIAREMGLPLYRLDIGSTMGKFVGESEKGLDAALAQADRCAPCVILLDEIEKVFGGVMQSGDSGVSTRALSKLLWWLQEHQSLVLTVMTTNNAKALPPELIREGRIDSTMQFPALSKAHGWAFMVSLRDKYKQVAPVPDSVLEAEHEKQFADAASLSHAHLTGVVLQLLKKQYLNPTPAKKATKSKTPKSGA